MKKLIFILLAVLTISGCKEQNEGHSANNMVEEYEILDSIKVNYQGVLSVIDFCPSSKIFLSVDRVKDSKVFLVFNEQGKILLKFENSSSGPMAFRGDVNSLTFDEKCNGFWLLTQAGIYHYNLDGEQTKFVEDENSGERFLPSDYNLIQLESNSSNLFFSLYKTPHLGYTLNEMDFYKHVKMFSKINIESSSFEGVLGFEKESEYLIGNRIYPPFFSYSEFDPEKTLLYTTFSNDTSINVYKYNNGNFSLQQRIPLKLDFYKIKKENYNLTEIDHYKAALDSRIDRLLISNNRIFISYVKGMDHGNFLSSDLRYNGDEFYQEFVIDNYRHCLSILENGEKIGSDIELSEFMTAPSIAFSDTELLVGLNRSKIELQNEVFLRIKINK